MSGYTDVIGSPDVPPNALKQKDLPFCQIISQTVAFLKSMQFLRQIQSFFLKVLFVLGLCCDWHSLIQSYFYLQPTYPFIKRSHHPEVKTFLMFKRVFMLSSGKPAGKFEV